MTRTTMGRELKALNANNNLGLLLTLMTPSHELKVLNVITNSGLWLT